MSQTNNEARRELEGDRALTDKEICAIFGFSKMTLARHRAKLGLPGPHFRLGQSPYTWRSKLAEWVRAREEAGVDYSIVANLHDRPRQAQPEQ